MITDLMDIDEIALSYVQLAQKLNLHWDGFVDAYYGPAKLRLAPGITKERFPLDGLAKEAEGLLQGLIKAKEGRSNVKVIIYIFLVLLIKIT